MGPVERRDKIAPSPILFAFGCVGVKLLGNIRIHIVIAHIERSRKAIGIRKFMRHFGIYVPKRIAHILP